MFIVAFLCTALVSDAQNLKGLPNDRPIPKTNASSSSSFPPPAQNCSRNEVWTSCWSSTCWEPKCGVATTDICSRDCKFGCRCADGFARNGSQCIPALSCPRSAAANSFNQTAQSCEKNEVWTSCSSSSCFEHRCGVQPSLLCTRDCRMGCKCADGFARLDSECVEESQCITWRIGKAKGKGKNTQQPTRTPTQEPTAAPEVLFVGPFRKPCEDDASTRCLTTKSAKATDFSANVVSIEGFDFAPGFDYKLRVRAQRIKAGVVKYILVSVTSKTSALQGKATAATTESECAEVICMVFCEHGYKRDAQGCEICSCLPSPTVKVCPDVTCDNLCPAGYQRNSAGCATCNCAPVPTTLISPTFNCNSAVDWSLAKVAACCVPLPTTGPARTLCQSGFQSGFVSLPLN